MSALGWLELEQLGLGNNTSEEDELTRVSAIRKESEGLDVPVAPLVSNMHPATRSYIDNQVRQVVKEELEKGNLMHYIQCFLSRQGNVSEPRRLSLVFSQNVSSPVLTGRKIKGNGGIFINLALVDRLTREVVKNGPEAAAKVEILVLKADRHEACNGKYEDLNNRIVGKIQGKNSVLQGTTALKLKEGICSIDNLSFTHNACWTRNSKFCLGARAVNSFLGTTIEPAETEPFDLKDNRVTDRKPGRCSSRVCGMHNIYFSRICRPISGGSMNPARTFGPAVASSNYKGLWVYIVGPVTGTLLGALSYDFIRAKDKPLP